MNTKSNVLTFLLQLLPHYHIEFNIFLTISQVFLQNLPFFLLASKVLNIVWFWTFQFTWEYLKKIVDTVIKIPQFHAHSINPLIIWFKEFKGEMNTSLFKKRDMSKYTTNLTRGPQSLMSTWVSETLHWLLFRMAHICRSTTPV